MIASPEDIRAVRLRYYPDSQPGWQRIKSGCGFRYLDQSGQPLPKKDVERIRALVIPPAWNNVWLSPYPNGYLLAVGRDAKGRKQAIYHPDWRAHRDEAKFGRLKQFGRSLPKLRMKADADLRKHGTPKERIVAVVVRLLETTLIRVGNREYAKSNESYGLTTLLNRHVKVGGSRLRFRFKGKSGKEHEVEFSERRLAPIVRRCQELPGQSLFQYLDEDGNSVEVDSNDVNEYIREATGQDFTAKDFRTWAATLETFKFLSDCEAPVSDKDVVAAVKFVAQKLGNTPTVCRASYIHPAVISAFRGGKAVSKGKDAERALLRLLPAG